MIECDDKLVAKNENHILKEMGLTDTNETEIAEIFSDEMNVFLKTHKFINSDNNSDEEEQEKPIQNLKVKRNIKN